MWDKRTTIKPKEDSKISTGDLKKGISLEIEGQLLQIVDWQHIKMGRGGAIVRIKFRNLRTGANIERTFDAGERFQRAFLERRPVQYSYNDGDAYYFMDNETYDQLHVSAENVGNAVNYLKEGDTAVLPTFEDEVIGIDLPASVERFPRPPRMLKMIQEAGFSDAMHVQGGIVAWGKQLEPDMVMY